MTGNTLSCASSFSCRNLKCDRKVAVKHEVSFLIVNKKNVNCVLKKEVKHVMVCYLFYYYFFFILENNPGLCMSCHQVVL